MTESERRIALVTGANRGLGFETARRLIELGYRVVLAARDEQAGAARAAELGREAAFLPLDVTDEGKVARLAEHAANRLGRVDVLVNNAGISLSGFDERVVRKTLAVNFFGPLRVTEALRSVIPSGGRIVMVSSGMGELSGIPGEELRRRFADPALTVEELVALVRSFERDVAEGRHTQRGWPSSAYRVSKVALNALTRIWAPELERAGIKINAVCPGWVRTRMGGSAASRSVEQGASGIVWAATLPETGPTGGFFRDGKPIPW